MHLPEYITGILNSGEITGPGWQRPKLHEGVEKINK